MGRLASHSGFGISSAVSVVFGVGACLAWLRPAEATAWIVALGAAACVATLVMTLGRRADSGGALASAAGTLFAGVYPGLLLAFLVALRVQGEVTGRDLVFFLVAVIWSSDTAAYYVGRALGRHPLSPRLSPKKTVEGAVAGILAAAGAAVACGYWFFEEIGPAAGLVGAGLGALGIVGDLAESALKRGAGVKDTSGILPGHGGILDRVDALMLAAPAFYYYYLFALA
jgi:phosphatidate cytidylyltransferase